MLNFIGKGVFGMVHVCPEDCKVAVKVIIDDRETSLDEIAIMRQFDHPCLLKVLKHTLDDASGDRHYLPRFETDLNKYIRSRRQFPLKTCVHFARQLLDGLACLHAAKVLHRDIKPDNLFVNPSSATLVIGDFGWARSVVKGRENTLLVCAVGYSPPERVLGAMVSYTEKIDIFSAGAVIYELFTSCLLFLQEKIIRRLHQDFFAKGEMPVTTLRMSVLQTFMWKCMMRRNPRSRVAAKVAAVAFLRDGTAGLVDQDIVVSSPVQ